MNDVLLGCVPLRLSVDPLLEAQPIALAIHAIIPLNRDRNVTLGEHCAVDVLAPCPKFRARYPEYRYFEVPVSTTSGTVCRGTIAELLFSVQEKTGLEKAPCGPAGWLESDMSASAPPRLQPHDTSLTTLSRQERLSLPRSSLDELRDQVRTAMESVQPQGGTACSPASPASSLPSSRSLGRLKPPSPRVESPQPSARSPLASARRRMSFRTFTGRAATRNASSAEGLASLSSGNSSNHFSDVSDSTCRRQEVEPELRQDMEPELILNAAETAGPAAIPAPPMLQTIPSASLEERKQPKSAREMIVEAARLTSEAISKLNYEQNDVNKLQDIAMATFMRQGVTSSLDRAAAALKDASASLAQMEELLDDSDATGALPKPPVTQACGENNTAHTPLLLTSTAFSEPTKMSEQTLMDMSEAELIELRAALASRDESAIVHILDSLKKGRDLRQAAKLGSAVAVRRLLAAGANADAEGSEGEVPLLLAAQYGHTIICVMLLDAGARPTVRKRDDGYSSLHYAAAGGHYDTCKLLLERGAVVKARASDGSTALHTAAVKGHTSTCLLLLEHGADVLAKATEGPMLGCNPVDAAMANEHEKTADAMQEHLEAAKRERRDSRRRSAIMDASRQTVAHGAETLRAFDARRSRGDITDRESEETELLNLSRRIFGGRVPPAFASFHRRRSTAGSVTERDGSATDRSGCATDRAGSATDRAGSTTDRAGSVTERSARAARHRLGIRRGSEALADLEIRTTNTFRL